MGTLINVQHKVLKKGIHVMTSPFGMRTLKGVTKMHKGIDFVSNTKSDGSGYNKCDYITALADGVVSGARNDVSGKSPSEGNYVIISHANNWQTVYFHLQKGSVRVDVGDRVKAGDVIGYMGATGNVTGAHLHFGIRKEGTYVDPTPYLEGTKSIYQSGDVNGDEQVNISDVTELLNVLAGPEQYNVQADVNNDGVVSIADVTTLQSKLSGKEEKQYAQIMLSVLKKGDKGSEVKTLQRLLKTLGYKGRNGKDLSIDGTLGSNTSYAIETFKQDKNLKINSNVDADTWNALLK